MANEENLIPLKGNDDVRSVAIRDKLKGSSSDKRKMSAKLRCLKEATDPKKIEKQAMELATDPRSSALTIMQMIKGIKDKGDLKPSIEIQLIRALTQAHTAIHGNKSLNLNINADAADSAKSMSEIYKIVKYGRNTDTKNSD